MNEINCNREQGKALKYQKIRNQVQKLGIILSIFVFVCFFASLFSSVYVIISNRYFNYKMFRLIVVSLQKQLNTWMIMSILLFVSFLVFYYVFKFVIIILFRKVLDFNILDKKRLSSILLSFLLSLIFFICIGWAINHYLLPHKFHPFSLIIDFVIFVVSILLGCLFARTNWEVIARLFQKTSLIILGFVLILNISSLIYNQIQIPDGPNIILITVDTLRADHLGCYGYNRNTSPYIDSFTKDKDSIMYENCFSQAPLTNPSCSSILSGFFPHETQVLGNGPLPLEVNTIAEFLRNIGYKTIAVVSNYVLRKKNDFNQGCDIYDDKMDARELVRNKPERIAKKTTDFAIKYLKMYKRKPFFMWIHYQDPHGPYTPQPPFDDIFWDLNNEKIEIDFNNTVSGKGGIPIYQKLGEEKDYNYYVSQYDGEILFLDTHFGRLIEALKEMDLYDNSIIIFTSDHGEGMGEHNYFFAHGEYIYNCLIHVPLVIKLEKGDNIRNSIRRSDYVNLIDILPTILDAVGIPKNLPFRGQNILYENSNENEIFAEMQDEKSIIFNRFKLIYRPLNNEYFLFNLDLDFHEKNNLFFDINNSELVRSLVKRLETLQEKDFLNIKKMDGSQKLTQKEKDRLKSLGYIK